VRHVLFVGCEKGPTLGGLGKRKAFVFIPRMERGISVAQRGWYNFPRYVLTQERGRV